MQSAEAPARLPAPRDADYRLVTSRADALARPSSLHPHRETAAWQAPAAQAEAIFIGGAPRSGTTLLRAMLDSHARIACGPELRVVSQLVALRNGCRAATGDLLRESYGTDAARLDTIFAELVLGFLRPGWARSGKARIAEKTPSNVFAMPALAELFPRAHLVHVLRDGRDVVASRLTARWRPGEPQPRGYAAAHAHATEWAAALDACEPLRRSRSPRFAEVRYETLVRSPELAMRRLLSALGEPWDPNVLRHHEIRREVDGVEEWSADEVRKPVHAQALGRWRTDLLPEERAAVRDAAGDALISAGYASDAAW